MSASLSLVSESGLKRRVAICGAGIAGLVLAITIGKYDPSLPIDMYEAHDSINTAGVGISMWRQTLDVMAELGLSDDLEQILTMNTGQVRRLRRSDIREGGYNWFHRVNDLTAMHRQHLVTILEKRLPSSCTVHFRKRLVNYVEQEQQDGHSSPVILEFTDRSTATCDVLVGADGIRSAVRKTMFESASKDDDDDEGNLKQYADATFAGVTIYRGLVPMKALKLRNPNHLSSDGSTTYTGRGKYLITYPIAEGTLVNFLGHVYNPSLVDTHYEGRWVSDATRDELVQHYHDFEPDARTVLELCEKPSKWALHVVKPLPFCARKRVVLIGDACHAMTPQLGSGAGQAIEDAFVLGRLLAHPLTSGSRIPDALRIYEEVRLSFAQSLASLSLSSAWMYPFMAPGYYDGTRKDENLDERGISAYERNGMETVRQELERRWNYVGGLDGALQHWRVAEVKLRTLVARLSE